MGFYNKLKIGTKIMVFVGAVVIAGIFALSYIVINNVSSNIKHETEQVLINSSHRYAGHIELIFTQMSSIVLNTASILDQTAQTAGAQNLSPKFYESAIRAALDNADWVDYGFVYLLDPPKSFLENKNFVTPQGKFIISYHDKDSGANGNLERLSPNDSIASFPGVISVLEKAPKDKRFYAFSKPFNASYGNGHAFLGSSIVAPLFDEEGKLIGVIGLTFNFDRVTKYLENPALVTFEREIKAVVSQDGIIVSHPNANAIGKNAFEINQDARAATALNGIKEGATGLYDDYVATDGDDSYAAVVSFKTAGDVGWTIFTTAPKESVLAPLYRLETMIAIVSLVVLAVVLGVVFVFVQRTIAMRLPIILRALNAFFGYINHESNEVHHIKIRAQDELGQLGMMINDNIDKSRAHLKKDEDLVAESLEVINHTKEGHATKRITLEGSNPQLNKLRSSVNELLDLLSNAIGNDLHELNRVFDSFVKLDFSTQVANAQGRVEVVT
ncbi:hypothetical protein BA723_08720, partial [Helicobacter sp. CLO-3]